MDLLRVLARLLANDHFFHYAAGLADDGLLAYSVHLEDSILACRKVCCRGGPIHRAPLDHDA